jgi:hypothetical protein
MVTKTGNGTVSGNGIDCGGACSASVADQAPVSLSATPDFGWAFSSWTGAGCSTGSCNFTMTGDTTVNATFTALPLRTLTITLSGTGTGSVTSTNVPGVTCSTGTCMFQIPDGTTVDLSASAGMSSTFKTWSNACSGMGSCQVTLGAAGATVGADFEPIYTLTINMHPNGGYPGASVMSNPSGINCTTGTCTKDFAKGTPVTLTGSVSMDWGYCASAKTCDLAMTSNRTLEVYPGYAHVRIQVRDYTTMSSGYIDFSYGGQEEFNNGMYGGTNDKANVPLGSRSISLDVTTGSPNMMFQNVANCPNYTSNCNFDLEDEIDGTITVSD